MLESPVRPEQPQFRKKLPLSKQLKKPYQLAALVLLCSLGMFALRSCHNRFLKSHQQISPVSSLVSLRSLAPTARQSQLKTLIQQPEIGLSPQQLKDRHRASYLLAADLIQQGKGKQALSYLQELRQDYPLLRPLILLKIAQAYQQDHQLSFEQKTLHQLIQQYPNSPFSANALALLGENKPLDLARLVQQFPTHPLTQEIARQHLRQNPNQYELLLLLAKYSRGGDLNPIRDRLVLEYSAKLTPEDWEAIADGYWRDEEHRKAADAYSLAESIPRNLYRAARAYHRNGNLDTAYSAYQRLVEEYHDSQEAGEALIHLASISSGDEAVVYLEKAIIKFPEVAPQAYRSKAIVHERFGKYAAANQSRQKLLKQFGDSPSAAEYRWQKAQALAADGNIQEAWQWMQPVIKSPPEQDFAAQALYSAGKWAQEIHQPQAAKNTFQQIIKLYPQSYWAWRAAVMLRWDVGDFNRLRPLSPTLDLTKTYEPLPMGSAALQELYLLGQYDDAWLLLQSEIEHSQQTSVNEQFTEGVLLLELGQYSKGMQQIWDLTKRETPQELAQWKALRQTKTYWQSLFPFPYKTQILQNAQANEINPLLVISVMRKESTFNPAIDSEVGAVGLMQLVPPTAQWAADQIGLTNYSLTNPEDNIKLGTWYLNHNHQRYQDNSLLAVASYNAGTGNVSSWLQKYDIKDRDRFVEQIPFPETKDYVEGVFGNYWNYLRLYNSEIRQQVEALSQPTKKPLEQAK